MKKIRPLHNQVLIKQHQAEETTKTGLYIPKTAQEDMLEGEVLAVGEGRILDNGTRLTPSVKPGDVVMFAKHTYVEVKIEDEKYIMMLEDSILGVIEKD